MSQPNKTYRSHCTITDKYQVKVSAREHTLYFDEPSPISNNEGMTPLEGLLGAIGACKSIVFKTVARTMGIAYESVEIVVEGDFDSRGYQGNPDFCIGFSEIRTIYTITSDASTEQLNQLIEYVDHHCPAAATIKDSTPLKSVLNHHS